MIKSSTLLVKSLIREITVNPGKQVSLQNDILQKT